jgi:transketolase
MTTLRPDLRERVENTIRFLTLDAVHRANSGHVGAPMGLARAALELWDRHLRFDLSDPDWPLRDRFVLSNGHASMLLYSLLHLYGYDLPLEQIANFRQLHSKTPGHPEYGDTPGVELTTGPLGQGFAHGVGMALAARATRARFGNASGGPGHHTVYGIVSDGDLMEGVSSEAGSLAGHLGLGNLVYLYDDNRITIDGRTELSFSENVRMRFEAQRWHVQEADGQDAAAVSAAIEAAREETERPSLVITRTTIGFGADFADTPGAHGNPCTPENLTAAKQAAGWPLEPQLFVPDDVRSYCAGRAAAKRAARVEEDAELARWREANAERATAWDDARARRVPDDLVARLAEDRAGVEAPTRKHAAVALERLEQAAPYLIGGSADLAGSAAPPILKGRGIIGSSADGADPFAGVNLHFGVREHAMGAITNGIALDGTLRPYCGTFLIFSDYMRPAIRLAALMKIPSVFVFTHDSIGVGEDGPTHQPIEQLDSLRAVPGLTVFRPADGIEASLAWAWIAKHTEGPALLALSRQKVKALERPAGFELEDVWRGGYAVRECDDPSVVLVATGSEVSLACDAAEKLACENKAVRVVSLPSLELFLAQPEEYRRQLVPADGTPVIAVEAGCGESLRRLVDSRGLVYGIDRFGASAPYADLAVHFGFTPDRLCARVLEHLEQLETSG